MRGVIEYIRLYFLLILTVVLKFVFCFRDAKKNKGKKGNKKDSDSEDEKGSNNDSIIAQNYQDADRNGDQDSPPPGNKHVTIN